MTRHSKHQKTGRLKDRKTDRVKDRKRERNPKIEKLITRIAGNLKFYRNRDTAGSVSKFNISKLKNFHNTV